MWESWTHPRWCESLSSHDLHVRAVQRAVKEGELARKQISLKRSNSKTHCTRQQSYKTGCHLVDASKLNGVISVNQDEMTVDLEPMCRMDVISVILQEFGCTLPVTPEFRGITIGGTIAGGGLESSAFRYGMVQQSVVEFDIVLGDGSLVTASPTHHPDLFYGTMFALGTTGIVVRIRSKIVKTKPWVHLRYTYFDNRNEYVAAMTEACRNPHPNIDFLEGVELTKDCAVLITGVQCDASPSGVKHYQNCLWFNQWFIQHLEEKPQEAVMCLTDYLFRWDRGIYWNARRKINPTLLNRILFGWLFDMETSHAASRLKTDHSNEETRILTDVGPALECLKSMMDYNEEHVHVYPVWHLPFRLFPNEHHIYSCEAVVQDEFCVDYGIYGQPKHSDGRLMAFDCVATNKAIEKHVHQHCKGMKGFETVCYYTKDEFWNIFDVDKYDKLRRKYHAESAFPTVLSKLVS